MDSNAKRYELKQKDCHGLIQHDLTFNVIRELDYILLGHDRLKSFGYGSTLKEAVDMLISCLEMTKKDLIEKLITAKNTSKEEYLYLCEVFGVCKDGE